MLFQGSPLLLIDEPTANLDSIHQKQILELIKKQKTTGHTVIVVLHDINHALSIADKILVLESGKLIFDGKPEDMINKKILENIFGLKKYEFTDNDNKKGVIFI